MALFFKGKINLYPKFFKVVRTYTPGTLLCLAINAALALFADAIVNNPTFAASDAIRPVSTEGNVGVNQAENSVRNTPIKAPGGLERLKELNLLSEALVEKAESGSTPAHEFRVEARMYRELLRQVMLSNRSQSTSDQLPRNLLMDMVRMSALLHAAADCKTGFVIICPADLMLQLKSQQSSVTQGLHMFQMTYE